MRVQRRGLIGEQSVRIFQSMGVVGVVGVCRFWLSGLIVLAKPVIACLGGRMCHA